MVRLKDPLLEAIQDIKRDFNSKMVRLKAEITPIEGLLGIFQFQNGTIKRLITLDNICPCG